MKTASPVLFTDVLNAVRATRSESGSWPWTLRLLEQAHDEFGAWFMISLTGLEAGEIMLPPHAGEPCHGDRLALVPVGGSRVSAAAVSLTSTTPEYSAANKTCWSRIDQARDEPFSPIVVSAAPLNHPDYRSLERNGSLIHLDGFHRLIGWALARRLTAEARIRTYVAGTLDER